MKNRNANRLLRDMKRLAQDVNDTEICKKFETLIKGGNEIDFPASITSSIMEDPSLIEDNQVPELYLMYFRHYRYMRKREQKMIERGEIQPKRSRSRSVGKS